jgi:hypothetical protein
MRARCVITEQHLADRRKASPVWSSGRPRPEATKTTYLPGSTAGVPCTGAGRAIRGPDLRWSAGLDRHTRYKIWPDCNCKKGEMGM